MKRALAAMIVRAAAYILPTGLHNWGGAMIHESDAIEDSGEALDFAFGCLTGALGFHLFLPPAPQGAMAMQSDRLGNPRRMLALAALGATALGLVYMAVAGAPIAYLAMNVAGLAWGFISAGLCLWTARSIRLAPGPVVLALALALLAASLFGTHVDGATRWLAIGRITIQPSLVLLPVLVLLFARVPGLLGTAGIALAALALALQPDRAMAGALVAGMVVLAGFRPERNVLIAAVIAIAGFAVTLWRPDVQGAMPYVDQIYYTAFDAHPLAGMAVIAGTALLLVPALLGLRADPQRRDLYLVFAAVWLATIVAAALGNYPTPLVGYGSSAIIGYVVSLLGMPGRAVSQVAGKHGAAPRAEAETSGHLRVGLA